VTSSKEHLQVGHVKAWGIRYCHMSADRIPSSPASHSCIQL